MGKKINVSLYIDETVIAEAKETGLNISKTCENCLKEKIKLLKGTIPVNQPNGGTLTTKNQCLVGRAGLEPTTFCTSSRCPTKLDYRPSSSHFKNTLLNKFPFQMLGSQLGDSIG